MGAHVAIHAAHARKKEENREEEDMTRYTPVELEEGWEFKILRSQTSAFKNNRRLAEALDEEGMAGWELVEKFDDGRLRLKRPASARQQDGMLPPGYDPYRTSYGLSEGLFAFVVVLIVFGMVGVGMGIAYAMGAF